MSTTNTANTGRLLGPLDLVGDIIAFESGELGDNETIRLFANLVKTGLAWSLQGNYGRFAERLIRRGFINREGNVLQRPEKLAGEPIVPALANYHPQT